MLSRLEAHTNTHLNLISERNEKTIKTVTFTLLFLLFPQRSSCSCCGACTSATPYAPFPRLSTSRATWPWPSTMSSSYQPSSTSSGGYGEWGWIGRKWEGRASEGRDACADGEKEEDKGRIQIKHLNALDERAGGNDDIMSALAKDLDDFPTSCIASCCNGWGICLFERVFSMSDERQGSPAPLHQGNERCQQRLGKPVKRGWIKNLFPRRRHGMDLLCQSPK